MKVEIYAETNVKSPKRQSGTYGYILVYRPPGGADDATISDFVKEEDITPHEIELKALIKALGRLRRPCEVVIIQSNPYVMNMSRNLPKWQGNGWKTVKGEEIKSKDLWQQLYKEMQTHSISWGQDQGYQGWLLREIEKRKD